MKKSIALILALAMTFTLAGCGKAKNEAEGKPQDTVQDTVLGTTDGDADNEEASKEGTEEKAEDTKTEDTSKKAEEKPAENKTTTNSTQSTTQSTTQSAKPNTSTSTNQSANQSTSQNTQQSTQQKPAETPVQQPSQGTTQGGSQQTSSSIGATLLNDFTTRVKANSSLSANAIAGAVVKNSIIEFRGMAVDVSEGNLNGFSAPISGFESGAMFAPMIGSIPFVGYVFKLPQGANVETFKSTLKANANMRWNVCTQADEMIVGNVGNTVFFLMCPKSFEE